MPWEEGLVQPSPDVIKLCFCAVFQYSTWVQAGTGVGTSAWSTNLPAGAATHDQKSCFDACLQPSGDLVS